MDWSSELDGWDAMIHICLRVISWRGSSVAGSV